MTYLAIAACLFVASPLTIHLLLYWLSPKYKEMNDRLNGMG